MFPLEDFPAVLAMQTGKPVTGKVMGVQHFNDESMRWISVDAVPRLTSKGTVPCEVYTTFTDITDRMRGRQELVRDKERAEEADKLKVCT